MSHITACPDEGRAMMFTESALDLADWLEEMHINDDLILAFLEYLISSFHAVQSYLPPYSDQSPMAFSS